MGFLGHDIDKPDVPPEFARFPKQMEPKIRLLIRQALDDLNVTFGVSSASAGCDILFLEEMSARQGEVRVVLPCERGDFVKRFLPRDWTRRFDKALDRDGVNLIEITDGDPLDIWAEFGARHREEVERVARQLDQIPEILAVWDGRSGFIRGAMSQWKANGFRCHVVPIETAASGGEAARAD